MSEAPPSLNLPVCAAITMVDPNAKVSGSTWVACALVLLVNVSLLILVRGTAAYADGVLTNTAAVAAAASTPARMYQRMRIGDLRG